MSWGWGGEQDQGPRFLRFYPSLLFSKTGSWAQHPGKGLGFGELGLLRRAVSGDGGQFCSYDGYCQENRWNCLWSDELCPLGWRSSQKLLGTANRGKKKERKEKRQPGKTELKIGDSLIMYMYFYLTFPNWVAFFKRRKIFPNLFKWNLIRESLGLSNYLEIYFEERRKGRPLILSRL